MNNNRFRQPMPEQQVQMNITPDMLRAENAIVCNECNGDLWLFNVIGRVYKIPNPLLGNPPIDLNWIDDAVCINCLMTGNISLRSRCRTRKEMPAAV